MGPIKPLHVFRRSGWRGVGRGDGVAFPGGNPPPLALSAASVAPLALCSRSFEEEKDRQVFGGVQGISRSGAAGRLRGRGRAAGLWARGRWAVSWPCGTGTRRQPGAGLPWGLVAGPGLAGRRGSLPVGDLPLRGARCWSELLLSGVCCPRQVSLPRWWRPCPRVPPGVTPAIAAPFRRRSRSAEFVLLPEPAVSSFHSVVG